MGVAWFNSRYTVGHQVSQRPRISYLCSTIRSRTKSTVVESDVIFINPILSSSDV